MTATEAIGPARAGVRKILGHNTLPEVDFRTRVEVAAEAGFTEIGYSILAYPLEDGASPKSLRATADAHGVHIAELEVLLGFDNRLRLSDGPRWGPDWLGMRTTDRRTEEQIWALASALGVDHLVAVGSFGDRLGEDAAELFAGLCDRAAEHGLVVALEFVPGTNVADIPTALGVVEAAARPNAGIVLDLWHHRRGTDSAEALASMPADLVTVVHVSDGPKTPAEPGYFLDTMTNRRLPGDGELDVAGFLRTVWDLGVDAPLSLEVLSGELHALPAGEVARAAASSINAVVELATADPRKVNA
jgi:sugar phosphate isomerase/epimerase